MPKETNTPVDAVDTAAAAPAKEAKPKKEPIPKVINNGVTRPGSAVSAVGRVWAIADELSAKLGSPAPRAAVLEAAAAEELHPATVATQYGRWRTFNGLKGQPAIRRPKAEAPEGEAKPKKAKGKPAAAPAATVEGDEGEAAAE